MQRYIKCRCIFFHLATGYIGGTIVHNSNKGDQMYFNNFSYSANGKLVVKVEFTLPQNPEMKPNGIDETWLEDNVRPLIKEFIELLHIIFSHAHDKDFCVTVVEFAKTILEQLTKKVHLLIEQFYGEKF